VARGMDTRNEGLDLMVPIARTFADTPWLHYGMWAEGEKVSFPNLRAAQQRYVDKLLSLLPAAGRLLDIGGGTGELAHVLAERGHAVDMLTPSVAQAELARQRLGTRARVVQTRFEDFAEPGPYDICVWSESLQYVPLAAALAGTRRLLEPGGVAVIADCFRSEGHSGGRAPGGGHRWTAFMQAVGPAGFEVTHDEDVTAAVAPSMLLDQMVYRDVAAPTLAQLSGSLKARRPMVHGLLSVLYRTFTSRAQRQDLAARLAADYRSPEAFRAANTYRFVRLGAV